MIKKIFGMFFIILGILGLLCGLLILQPFLILLSIVLVWQGVRIKKLPKNLEVKNHISTITNHSTENTVNTVKEMKAERYQTAKSALINNFDTEMAANGRKHIYFNVAGISKQNDENKKIQSLIKKLVKEEVEIYGAFENMTNKEILEFGDDIYEVNISGSNEITFQPEPDNPYDSNAIKIIHDEIGHIGYVPRIMTKKVLKATSSDDYDIEWKLIGGKLKYIDFDDFGEEKIRTKTLNYGITIDLYY